MAGVRRREKSERAGEGEGRWGGWRREKEGKDEEDDDDEEVGQAEGKTGVWVACVG